MAVRQLCFWERQRFSHLLPCARNMKAEGEGKAATSKTQKASRLILDTKMGKQWDLQGVSRGRGTRIWYRRGGLGYGQEGQSRSSGGIEKKQELSFQRRVVG